MMGHIYRDVILEQHKRLFRGAMTAEFLFMNDNANPHRANIVDECLQSEDITRMDWPAYSPDLNPIKHVWDMLGRRIETHQPVPTCLPKLRRALLDEWCNIPQDQIDNLILCMSNRCKAYFASSGSSNDSLPGVAIIATPFDGLTPDKITRVAAPQTPSFRGHCSSFLLIVGVRLPSHLLLCLQKRRKKLIRKRTSSSPYEPTP
ncbi:transposable element Tcb1 transposase [Trichonephila clavipes]|uniref:Transposable element Tcb1 transposase n=1 Tax=Trichonephila clavipes TaxID=2585209 RepID=A0A8X6VGS2_TRICX|nr:transposable element Tcb1 transposase [Trichonephila clavipes]